MNLQFVHSNMQIQKIFTFKKVHYSCAVPSHVHASFSTSVCLIYAFLRPDILIFDAEA